MAPRSYGGHTNVAPLRRVLVSPAGRPGRCGLLGGRSAICAPSIRRAPPQNTPRSATSSPGRARRYWAANWTIRPCRTASSPTIRSSSPTRARSSAGRGSRCAGARSRRWRRPSANSASRSRGGSPRPATSRGAIPSGSTGRRWRSGRGYRTDAEGIRQLTAILAEQGVSTLTVPLPHWHGPAKCLHLLSLISPLDERLAVVYPPAPAGPLPARTGGTGLGIDRRAGRGVRHARGRTSSPSRRAAA